MLFSRLPPRLPLVARPLALGAGAACPAPLNAEGEDR